MMRWVYFHQHRSLLASINKPSLPILQFNQQCRKVFSKINPNNVCRNLAKNEPNWALEVTYLILNPTVAYKYILNDKYILLITHLCHLGLGRKVDTKEFFHVTVNELMVPFLNLFHVPKESLNSFSSIGVLRNFFSIIHCIVRIELLLFFTQQAYGQCTQVYIYIPTEIVSA